MIGRGANGKSSKQWNILLDFHNRDFELYFDDDTPRVNKKGLPRSVRRRGNTRRKRNRNKSLPKQDKENMADPPNCIDQPKSKPAEEVDKQKVRRKSVLTSRPAEACGYQNKVVKFYGPLEILAELQVQPEMLYNILQPYVIGEKELKKNGFPPYHNDNPQSARFGYRKSIDPTTRWCCRCGLKYTVTEDGEYQSDTICRYHEGTSHGAGPLSCCGYNMIKPCATSKYHASAITKLKTVEFVKTREKKHASAQNKVYALDCEMCYTILGLEVTRVSVVGADGIAIYDTYVLPESPITDYNTRYSGITAKDLKDVKTTLPDVQAFLLKLLSAKSVLIGHALENDLKALRIIHETVVDTSVIFPPLSNPRRKDSLKALAKHYLQREIQHSSHDSIEDSRTCIELILRKVQSDGKLYTQPKRNSFHVQPVQQRWSANQVSINTHYNVTVLGPAVVPQYNYYFGGQVTA